MTKKTKMWLLGGAVAAAAVGGGVYYYTKKHPPQTPANAQLLPVNTFTKGKSYQFAAMLPSGISDTSALEAALVSAGWTNPTIDFFAGTGDKGPFPINANGYVAHGQWGGADGTGVPAGVVARLV